LLVTEGVDEHADEDLEVEGVRRLVRGQIAEGLASL
jgi:hypothetical protein